MLQAGCISAPGCLGPRPTACPSACLGCQDYVAGGHSICTFLQGLSLPLQLVPRRAAPPGPRGARSRAGKPPRAEGPAVSWGNRVLLGAAKCCTVTCLGLEGDSRTGGHQVAQWGWTQSEKPSKALSAVLQLTPCQPREPGCAVTAVSVSLPGVGTRSRTVCTGTLPSGQRAPSPTEVDGVGSCHQACQGGQAPVVALSCAAEPSSAAEPLLPSSPWLCSPRAPTPSRPCRQELVPAQAGWGAGAPPACAVPARGCREAGECSGPSTQPGLRKGSAGPCALGLWGEREGWSQRLKPWDPPDLLLPRALGT